MLIGAAVCIFAMVAVVVGTVLGIRAEYRPSGNR